MNRFLINILFFLLPLIGISILLDLYITVKLKDSHRYVGEIEVWEDIFNSRINCDIAIYGSSRAWVHINPNIIEENTRRSSYNFGVNGHNFWIQYLRHKEYIKNNPKPTTIIISVDAFTLAKREKLFNLNQFLPYMLWNKTIENYTSSYVGYSKLDYYIPFIRYFGKDDVLLSLLNNGNDNKKYRLNGFRGNNKQWNTDFDKAKKKMKEFEIKLDSSSIELFANFIMECQDLNIKLVFVYTPEFKEGQEFISNREVIVNIYKNFSEKYQIPFLDYSNNKICDNRELFYNSMHLNSKGANLFTEMLIKDLKHKCSFE
jgi:hypothetical protein